jgi:outer membrane protein assembly factor BamB
MFLAAAIAIPLSAVTAAAQDWPQFLGPTRNGVYSGAEFSTVWPKTGPALLWKKEIGQGFSAPVVANGRLILFHRIGDRETVECLDAGSGRRIWVFDYPTHYRDDFGFDEGPRATPAVGGGHVYTFGAEGALHCLDFATGKKIWSVDTQSKFGVRKGFFGAACSPLEEGDKILLNIGGANGAGIVAFHKDSGQILWTATKDEASYSAPVAVTIGSARHALFFTRSGLADLDPANGRVRFQFPWRSRSQASVNAATPLVVGDLVFLSASYGTGATLLQIENDKAKQVWSSDDALSNHYSTSVYFDGYLYGYHGRQEEGQSLRSVALKTGKTQWSADQFGAGTITLAGRHLVVLKESGELILAAATPKEFRPLARAQLLPPTVRSYPALAGGRLYVRNEKTLACFKLTEVAP